MSATFESTDFPATVAVSFSTAAWSMFWKSKLATFCGFPFSRIAKSDAFNPFTTSPVFLSRTTTFVSTRSDCTFNVNEPGAGWSCALAGIAVSRINKHVENAAILNAAACLP